MKIKHFLNFINDNYGRHQIREFINFSSTDFTLKQDDDRLGRDTSFSGGESRFIMTKFVHDKFFDKVQEYFLVYGNESEILYETEINGVVEVHGKIDFQTAKNNIYDKIEFSVIQEQTSELIKKREDLNVNLFSNKTLDDADITPCQTHKILLKSKPLLQYSELDMGSSPIFLETTRVSGSTKSAWYLVLPYLQPKKSGIKNTLLGSISTPSLLRTTEGGGFSNDYATVYEDYRILEANENLKDLKLNFEFEFDMKAVPRNGANGYVDYWMELRYGRNFWENYSVISSGRSNDGDTNTFSGTFNTTIPILDRGSKLWLVIQTHVRQSATVIVLTPTMQGEFTFKKWNVKLEAVSKGVNTAIDGVRLDDAVKYTSKSISGVETDFEFAETELYDHFVLNGNLLRNIQDKPFYMEWGKIRQWLRILNADYELTPDNRCFIGLEADYYKNVESGVFDSVFDTFDKTFNKRYLINKFQLEFENYQAKNENTDTNTNDTIHGQATFYTVSKGVENKKEIKIPFVYDPFLIEQKKREQLTKDDTTATKDDDQVFYLDCVPYQETTFTETFKCRHKSYFGGIKVTNDGSFSWLSLGLEQSDNVQITSGHNLGNFIVDFFSSTDRTLVLASTTPAVFSDNNEVLTTFVYTPTGFEYQVRTMEEVDAIDGFENPLDFANVTWGAGRCVKRYYNSYLATSNLFLEDKPIKNSSYTKNGNAVISANGLTTKESEEFIPTNQILSQFIISLDVICSFEEFLELKTNIKTQRGYIRTFDPDGYPVKLYPKELKFYNNSDKLRNSKLTIIGEEKYESNNINIVYSNNGFLVINGGTVISRLIYKEKRNKIYIFDDSNRLLFRPVFWQKVAVNGANAESIDELKSWLKQLE